jgi:hypothetical protein
VPDPLESICAGFLKPIRGPGALAPSVVFLNEESLPGTQDFCKYLRYRLKYKRVWRKTNFLLSLFLSFSLSSFKFEPGRGTKCGKTQYKGNKKALNGL